MILRIKCVKFYVYKVKPETLKFVVVVFLFGCLFVFVLLFIIIIIIIIISFEL